MHQQRMVIHRASRVRPLRPGAKTSANRFAMFATPKGSRRRIGSGANCSLRYNRVIMPTSSPMGESRSGCVGRSYPRGCTFNPTSDLIASSGRERVPPALTLSGKPRLVYRASWPRTRYSKHQRLRISLKAVELRPIEVRQFGIHGMAKYNTLRWYWHLGLAAPGG